MDCCDLTGEDCVWSQHQPAVTETDVSRRSLQNQPYLPLNHQEQPSQQQQQQQTCQSNSGQGCPPYRPLSSAAHSCQSQQQQPDQLMCNQSSFQQQQEQQQSRHNSSIQSSSLGYQQQPGSSIPSPSIPSSSGCIGQRQQHGAAITPAADSWEQVRRPGDYGGGYGSSRGDFNNYNSGYNSGRYSGGAGSGRGFRSGSPAYCNTNGSWGQMRSGGYNTGYNGGYSSGYGSGSSGYGGGMRSGSPGLWGSRNPPPRPQSGPLPWVKQGCWLVPRQATSAAAAAAAVASAAAAAAVGLSAADGAVAAAGAAGAVSAASSAAPAGAASSDAGGKVVIIMRGLPGSGKSTRAAELAEAAKLAAVAAAGGPERAAAAAFVIHSTDSYFIDPTSGVYVFNPELLGINHQKNFDAYCASLAEHIGTVIVDNTNIQPWQFEKYVTAAWQAGYRVRQEVVGEFTEAAAAVYAARNSHGVPHDKILIMLDQWRRQ